MPLLANPNDVIINDSQLIDNSTNIIASDTRNQSGNGELMLAIATMCLLGLKVFKCF